MRLEARALRFEEVELGEVVFNDTASPSVRCVGGWDPQRENSLPHLPGRVNRRAAFARVVVVVVVVAQLCSFQRFIMHVDPIRNRATQRI